MDIRVYTEIEGKADKVPTKKGVTLRPDLIPELMKALVCRVIRRRGRIAALPERKGSR